MQEITIGARVSIPRVGETLGAPEWRDHGIVRGLTGRAAVVWWERTQTMGTWHVADLTLD